MIYLIILCIGIFILGIYLLAKTKGEDESIGYLFLFAVLGLLFVLGIGIPTYCNSLGRVAKLESFYNGVCDTYKYTVEESQEITIEAIESTEFGEILNTGNLAYFELAKSVNSNLVALRNEIQKYNDDLYMYRGYNASWFLDSFFYDVPEYLKPIKMK